MVGVLDGGVGLGVRAVRWERRTELHDASLPHLAISLNNLSNRLGDLGRREEALNAITEAIRIRRALAQDRPQVHQSELEQALHTKAWLEELGDETGTLPGSE